MSDKLKIFHLSKFDNQEVITIYPDSLVKTNMCYYEHNFLIEDYICGLSMSDIYFKLRKDDDKFKMFRKFYCIASSNNPKFPKLFILSFGKTVLDIITESAIWYDTDIHKLFSLKVVKKMIDMGSHQTPSFKDSTLNPLDITDENIINKYRVNLDLFDYYKKWHHDTKFLSYLENRGVAVNDIIAQNREKIIDELL